MADGPRVIFQEKWEQRCGKRSSSSTVFIRFNRLIYIYTYFFLTTACFAISVPPKIYDISSDMTINEGTNVTLTCLATGKPEPSISWRHISPSAKPFENGQYLDIYGITRDQAGEYECSAENDVSFPDVKKVKIVVNFAPTIQEIKSGTVAPGRSGLIRCEGAGVPPPAFEWYKGEKKLFNGQQGIIIQNFSTRSILTVTNVTQEHFGNYTCVAVNKLGTANASLPLSR
ncbi:unnamed protein product, partial [Rangifer tarandus platyrhynchus]